MLHAFIRDLRESTRALLRARGFTAVTVGTLGASLALSVSVMTVVNAYLLRGLPYPHSERLFNVQYASPGQPMPVGMADLDWGSLRDLVEHPIAWDLDNFSLRGAPYPELAAGTWVTPGYVEGFGVRPALGRGFQSSDFDPGQPSVALISHRLWQSRFAGAPNVIGQRFEAHVNDRPQEVEAFTIIGVLPQGRWHMNVFTDVLAPLRGVPTFPYMVRLREGVSAEVAAQRITALVRPKASAMPANWRVELRSTHSEYVSQVRPLLLSLAAATALVLLIACANVAVLLTVRASQRRREFAVRKALGATAARIGSAVMADAVVLGAAATGLGIALAQVVMDALAPVMDQQLGRAAPGGAGALEIDGLVLAAAAAVGFLVTIACSLVPLWASSATPVALALTGGQKSATDGPGQRRARSTLIAIEVAASLALLVGAALMVQSGMRILNVDMGLDVSDVSVGRISLRPRAYSDPASQNAFYDQLHTRVARIPGVTGLAFANWWPLQAAPPREVTTGRQASATTRAGLFGVSTDYFSTLSIAVSAGRPFTGDDRPGSPAVAIVSATLARTLWPDRGAVGEDLRVLPSTGDTSPPVSYRVVGVVEDVRHTHTDIELADVYLALAQDPSLAVFTYVKTGGPLPTLDRDLRAAIAAADSELALGMPRPLAEILDQQRAGPRFLASLLVVFAALAAALALMGIYGVIAYAVRQREKEIAVRMAVGADSGAIVRLFLRQGAIVLAGGLTLGVAGAIGLGQVLQTQLFGVRAAEPAVLALATGAFAICGLAAIAWPARSAAGMDPAAALRD